MLAPDQRGALVSIIALSVIGPSGFLIMPVLLGSASLEFGLSPAQIGLLGSALMIGSVASAVSAWFWVRRFNWKMAARVALFLMFSGLAILLLSRSLNLVIAAMVLVSIGGGALYSLMLSIIAEDRESERIFGLSVTAQVAFQVAGMLLMGLFVSAGGWIKLVCVLAVITLAGVILTRTIPDAARDQDDAPALSGKADFPLWLALCGCLLFFLNVGCIWGYIELIGSNAGFGPSQLGIGLAIGVAVGMLGSLCTTWQGNRWGYVLPLTVASIGSIVAVLALNSDSSLALFIAALALYNFCWNYSLSYQYSLIEDTSPGGRWVSIVPAFHASGGAIGPALAATTVEQSGLGVVNTIAMAAIALSLIALYPAARKITAYITV